MGKIYSTEYNDIATQARLLFGSTEVQTPSQQWPVPTAIATNWASSDPTYGYGQDVSNIPNVSNDPANTSSQDAKILKTSWDNLRTHLFKAYRLQNGADPTVTLLPTIINTVNSATPVKVYQNTKDKFATMISSLQTTRYPSSWRLPTSEASADVISTATLNAGSWGGAGQSTRTVTTYVNFGSFDAARYFFNAGGELWIYTVASGGTSSVAGTKDYDWGQMLPGTATPSSGIAATGESPGESLRMYWDQITISNNGYPTSGAQTVAASYGFYNLPTAPTSARQVFQKTSTTPYNNNTFRITARFTNSTKNELEIIAIFTDGSANTVPWPSQGNAPWGIDETVGCTISQSIMAYRPYGTNKITLPAPYPTSAPTIV